MIPLLGIFLALVLLYIASITSSLYLRILRSRITKIDCNVQPVDLEHYVSILRPIREEVRGQVYSGDLLEYLHRHNIARWRSSRGGKIGQAVCEQRDCVTNEEIFVN